MEIVEISADFRRRHPRFVGVVWGVYAAFFAVAVARVAGWPFAALRSRMVDFHDFYLVGGMVDEGRAAAAYVLMEVVKRQRAVFGQVSFMPWTYPPQFDLVVGPLARLPLTLSFALFVGATFAAYAVTLHRLAPGRATSVFVLLSPSILLTIGCGQNGFLTGSLIAAAAIGLKDKRIWAGFPLGLMIIKPHLAVAIGLYAVLSRRWSLVLVAGLTIAATSALTTAILGFGVWPAFFAALKAASQYLSEGDYPEFRMISVYAMLHSLGAPTTVAAGGQIAAGGAAIIATALATVRFSPLQALGVAAIASVMISPYAYDYDMPVLGIGIAVLLDDFRRFGTLAERTALYVFVFGVQCIGYASVVQVNLQKVHELAPASIGCLSTIVTLAMAWRILERSRAPAHIKTPRGEKAEALGLREENCAA